MAVTFTYDPEIKSIHDLLARGRSIAIGSMTISAYANGGVTASLNCFTNLDAIFISTPGGRYVHYDHTNSLVKVYGVSTSTNTFEIASDTASACFTGTTFFAVGRF